MSANLYFPSDLFSAGKINYDVAADFLELLAFFSSEKYSLTSEIINASEISADENYEDVDAEIENREEVSSGAILAIQSRMKCLTTSYPFELDEKGDVLSYIEKDERLTFDQASYLLCLILSNLSNLTPILGGTACHPSDSEIVRLRNYFQYFATAALAAELNSSAWSFGHPRPDHTNFINKLTEIWNVLKDGNVDSDPSAPKNPKDDQVDIFTWKPHPDGLPGCLFGAAQVATGANWKDKSIKGHMNDVFWSRWFGRHPVTKVICYHIIPFTRTEVEFRDDVSVLGNILHRLRVPYKVREAANLLEKSEEIHIEAYDLLPGATSWIQEYGKRRREDARQQS